jgi:hypothetical protein
MPNSKNCKCNQGAIDQHEKTLTAVIIRIDLFCEEEHGDWDEDECNCGEIIQLIGAMSNA